MQHTSQHVLCTPARHACLRSPRPVQHPRGAVLLDAAFDSVRTLVLAVRAGLTSQEASSEEVYGLAFSAGGCWALGGGWDLCLASPPLLVGRRHVFAGCRLERVCTQEGRACCSVAVPHAA